MPPAQTPTLVEHLAGAPVRPGLAVWRLAGVVVAMPAPADDAPFEFLVRYFARLQANATSVCPLCGEQASLSADPEQALAAWRALPVTFGIVHSPSCPAVFTEDDRRWFDPRGLV